MLVKSGFCVPVQIFFVDLVLRFFIPTRHDRMAQQAWNRRTIAMNYARSWLLIDAMSIVPLDLVTLGKSDGCGVSNLIDCFNASQFLHGSVHLFSRSLYAHMQPC